jgi:hypothetical protein
VVFVLRDHLHQPLYEPVSKCDPAAATCANDSALWSLEMASPCRQHRSGLGFCRGMNSRDAGTVEAFPRQPVGPRLPSDGCSTSFFRDMVASHVGWAVNHPATPTLLPPLVVPGWLKAAVEVSRPPMLLALFSRLLYGHFESCIQEGVLETVSSQSAFRNHTLCLAFCSSTVLDADFPDPNDSQPRHAYDTGVVVPLPRPKLFAARLASFPVQSFLLRFTVFRHTLPLCVV